MIGPVKPRVGDHVTWSRYAHDVCAMQSRKAEGGDNAIGLVLEIVITPWTGFVIKDKGTTAEKPFTTHECIVQWEGGTGYQPFGNVRVLDTDEILMMKFDANVRSVFQSDHNEHVT